MKQTSSVPALTLPLVLASTSSYRKKILTRLNIPFETFAPNVDETAKANESPEEMVVRLAELKARTAHAAYPQALIIGSDQVVVVNNTVLGKPNSHEEAIKQLVFQSGQQANALTALCLLNTKTGRVQVDVVKFSVNYRVLTLSQIENYLVKEKPYDCASSLKSEGLGIALLEKMTGDDPTTLIGLPLIHLVQMLEAEGLFVI
ncbi:MAG: Maf family nucleotide pyrophosphatase [Methylococcales bacterium]|nr:Maf family nucleotide pyrophosphatase [Methylococcales bacterium]